MCNLFSRLYKQCFTALCVKESSVWGGSKEGQNENENFLLLYFAACG